MHAMQWGRSMCACSCSEGRNKQGNEKGAGALTRELYMSDERVAILYYYSYTGSSHTAVLLLCYNCCLMYFICANSSSSILAVVVAAAVAVKAVAVKAVVAVRAGLGCDCRVV
jgi:hypothetical protein